MKPRILLIGLDAATLDLIEPWCAEGRLSTLARLIDEGSSARLLSTPNMHSASSWTSILTGLNPGRHGLFVFSDRDFATGRQVFFTGGDRTGETIAGHLTRNGVTCGFLNVPMTYPARSLPAAFTVSGLDAPSLNAEAFWPHSLRSELFDRFPEYRYTPAELGRLMSQNRVVQAVESWIKSIRTQTAAACYLLEKQPVDFFMTVFTASDWGGHNLWKYLPGESDHQPGSELANGLLRIYQALDQAVDTLLKTAGDQCQAYIVSDHGMGRHSGASYHLAAWLESHGFMRRQEIGRRHTPSLSERVTAAMRVAGRRLPSPVKERLKSKIGGRLKQIQAAEKDSFYSSIDWSRTSAYSEPGRHVINVNLEGRNFAGSVPQADYDGLCNSIIERLQGWTDGRGKNLVQHVSRRSETYSGSFVERASDLYVYWNPDANAGGPPAEVRERGYWWSGDHRPEGVLICRGPNIRRGAVMKAPTVCDLLPTIAHLAGFPVPAGLDGRVIEELADDNSRRPVQFDRSARSDGGRSAGVSEDEEVLIEEKLRELGYL